MNKEIQTVSVHKSASNGTNHNTTTGSPLKAISAEKVIIGNCQIFLRAPFWEVFGVRPRIWCAELNSGRIVTHPLIAKASDGLRKSFEKIAAATPILNVRTAAGKLLTFDFASACDALASYDEKVPFYDKLTRRVSRIPLAGLSNEPGYHLTDDGTVAFTKADKKGCVKVSFSNAQKAEMQITLKMFTEIYGPGLGFDDLRSIINREENPPLFLAMLARISRVFARVNQSVNLTHDEKTEAYQLLMIAPRISAADYFTDTKPKYLTLDRAFEVMEEYHNEPGEAPHVPWTALIKV